MKKLEIKSTLTVFDTLDELPTEVASLMKKAVQARKNAYAPYSKFRVGAALELENGAIVVGNNQENAVYPSGLCAERVAIFQAGAIYPNIPIKRMAISASSDTFNVVTPIPPCGACRQSMYEYEENLKQPIELYFMGETGKVVKADSVQELLPLTFGKATLNNI
ncbi:cytidine deaminase [Joostella sp. CR20]|uniref:cytidine deaminase n=1 Tax=Joostella sp. CR20 TaxID=2804312 RepID=UPI00313DE4D7